MPKISSISIPDDLADRLKDKGKGWRSRVAVAALRHEVNRRERLELGKSGDLTFEDQLNMLWPTNTKEAAAASLMIPEETLEAWLARPETAPEGIREQVGLVVYKIKQGTHADGIRIALDRGDYLWASLIGHASSARAVRTEQPSLAEAEVSAAVRIIQAATMTPIGCVHLSRAWKRAAQSR
jgi:hypothetical protein